MYGEDFGRIARLPLLEYRRPCGRIGRQSPHEVHDALARLPPVDAAVLLEDLRCGVQAAFVEVHLLRRSAVPRCDAVDGRGDQFGAEQHQPFVERSHVVLRRDGDTLLREDRPLVDFVVEQERRDTRFAFAVDDGPVDRGRPPVFGKQRGVQVEGSQTGHRPDDFGQHLEGDDDSQIGLQRLQGIQKCRIAELFGLQYGHSQFAGGDLHVAFAQVPAAAGRFVGDGDRPDDVVPFGDEPPKRRDGEFGRTHEDDAQRFRIHSVMLCIRVRQDCRRGRRPHFRSSRRPWCGVRSARDGRRRAAVR